MYLFAIYSCVKYLDKAQKIYERINNKIINTKVYIFYGNLNIDTEYKIIDDKFIELKVKDDYASASNKTLAMIRHIDKNFSDIRGFLKCDDDVIVNIEHINKFINYLDTTKINYCGNATNIQKPYISKHKIKLMKTKTPIIVSGKYCYGPLYYLDKSVLCYFATNEIINYNPYEDVMVGNTLQKNNIIPTNYSLYSDDITNANIISFHNSKHYNKLYIYIHGGIGNQLFQIACGLYYAQKFNKKFVINTTLIKKNIHQNSKSEIIKNLQKMFPNIRFSNNKIDRNNFYKFNEEICFADLDKNISNMIYTYNNIILYGYFQHYVYLENNIIQKYIVNKPKDIKLLKYDFTNTCFIHIRLGDFINNEIHYINLEKYYDYCIKEILQKNKKTKFYICSNQYNLMLNDIIKKFQITNYVLQDETNNYNDTLFIMANCNGGICANSSLSYMGVYLQKEKNNIYVPYPQVNLINEYKNIDYSMYPKWANIYDTIKNKIVIL